MSPTKYSQFALLLELSYLRSFDYLKVRLVHILEIISFLCGLPRKSTILELAKV